MAQFGSGSALLGGTDALSQAIARRGVDVSAMQQTTPASAGGAAPLPTPGQPASPVSAVASSTAPQQGGVAGTPTSEAELILKALTGRLKALSDTGR